MKRGLFLIAVAGAALSSCAKIYETMEVLDWNRQAIDASTQAINENTKSIEEANRSIHENKLQLDEINETLKKASES
jgi:hypothetical protein